jgi:2-dehydropantoate 2-reductase
MNIGIIGAGGLGTYIGARLAASGTPVTLLARGAHAAAIRAHGVSVHEPENRTHVMVPVVEDAAKCGALDVAIVAVKAHQLASAIPAITAASGPATTVVYLQNGIPWWYGYEHPIARDWTLETVDPGGVLRDALDPARAVGAIVYFAANVSEPGVVAHSSGLSIVLGEPRGPVSARVQAVGDCLTKAGFAIRLTDRLRADVWQKLLGNMSFNPVTALTRAFTREAAVDPGTRAIVREMMAEGLAVAQALGDAPQITVDERIAMSPVVGDVRTSTLTDVLAGRRLEIGALLGAVAELGDRLDVPVPTTKRVFALVALLDLSVVVSWYVFPRRFKYASICPSLNVPLYVSAPRMASPISSQN